MRPTLGWGERDIRYLVGGVAPRAAVVFLPDDRDAADRALLAGRTLADSGDSPLRRGLAAVVDRLPLGGGTGRDHRIRARRRLGLRRG